MWMVTTIESCTGLVGIMKRKISVIGLGYVGLPVAVTFASKGFDVVAFDIDGKRIEELNAGHDRTGEVYDTDLAAANLICTNDPEQLKAADFHIVTVPTPIDEARRPDLGPVLSASRTVGSILKPGDIVVYESTVYPGCSEEDCVPVLEQVSGLTFGKDFEVGYSPERINPGDREHRFETIVKVVSGSNDETLDIVAKTYESVVDAGVHRAPNIKTAEASKVIENSQRDINIAFVNELSHIFNAMDIDTMDVLAAARTKWNFLPFSPGLVGGHCIGVDPYYLTHKAAVHGVQTEVILSGRDINDRMGKYVARECIKMVMRQGVTGERPVIAVLGATFKENVPDLRNSRVVDILHELESYGADIKLADPMADAEEVIHEFGYQLTDLNDITNADAVILAVPHTAYIDAGWDLVTACLHDGQGQVLDVKSCLDRNNLPDGVTLKRL